MSREVVERAARASTELRATEAAFDALRQAYIDEMMASSPGEQDKRERLYLAAKVVDQVRANLRKAIDAGRVVDAAEARKAIAESSSLLRP